MTAKNCLLADQTVFLAGGGRGESARETPEGGVITTNAVSTTPTVSDCLMAILPEVCLGILEPGPRLAPIASSLIYVSRCPDPGGYFRLPYCPAGLGAREVLGSRGLLRTPRRFSAYI